MRGGGITMIFQEPMASFSLVYTVGQQIIEGILNHQDVSKAEARNRTIEILGRVGISNPERRIDDYPFRLSGGMRQRCMIATTTLAIPGMIIAETSLSFLGLGMRHPAISWGVLLVEAQNLQSVALAPWLLLPGAFVFVTVVTLNLVGDGLRDAADPCAATESTG